MAKESKNEQFSTQRDFFQRKRKRQQTESRVEAAPSSNYKLSKDFQALLTKTPRRFPFEQGTNTVPEEEHPSKKPSLPQSKPIFAAHTTPSPSPLIVDCQEKVALVTVEPETTGLLVQQSESSQAESVHLKQAFQKGMAHYLFPVDMQMHKWFQ